MMKKIIVNNRTTNARDSLRWHTTTRLGVSLTDRFSFSQQFVSSPVTQGNDVFRETWTIHHYITLFSGVWHGREWPFRGRTGEETTTLRPYIDKYDNTITSVVIQGGHRWERYDNIKITIFKKTHWNKLDIQEEVFNLFPLVIHILIDSTIQDDIVKKFLFSRTWFTKNWLGLNHEKYIRINFNTYLECQQTRTVFILHIEYNHRFFTFENFLGT